MTVRQFQAIVKLDAVSQRWEIYLPAFHYLSTTGSTRDKALENGRIAILDWLERAAIVGIPAPADDFEAEVVKIEVVVA